MPGNVQNGTNTISFIARNNIPVVNTVKYSRIVVDVRPLKEDPIRVFLTVRRDIL